MKYSRRRKYSSSRGGYIVLPSSLLVLRFSGDRFDRGRFSLVLCRVYIVGRRYFSLVP